MNPDVLLNRIRLEQRGLIDIHKKLYEMEHLLPVPDPMQFAKTAESAALLSEKSTAHLRNMFFSVSNEPPIYYYPKAAEVQGIRVWADTNSLRVLLPALLPDKKKRDGCKFLLLPLQAALVQSGPLPHFSDYVICVEHIYDHNLPIRAVRDYDNLELKAVIDVIATFCLADDTGALCDSFQTTRFGYSSSTVNCNAEKMLFGMAERPQNGRKPTSTFFEKIVKIRYLCLKMIFPRCCKPIHTPIASDFRRSQRRHG